MKYGYALFFLGILFLQTSPISASLRIVSLSPSLTQIVTQLYHKDALVGVCDTCLDDQDSKITRVGQSFKPNADKIRSLNPDMILGIASPKNPFIQALRVLPAQDLFFQSPQSPADLYEIVQILGNLLKEEKRAKKIVGQLKLSSEEFKKKQSSIKPRVLFIVAYPPLKGASNRTFIHHLITLAGGKNVLSNDAEKYPTLPHKYILKENPEIVFISDPSIAEIVKNRTSISTTRAYKTNFVISDLPYKYFLNPSLDFPEAIRALQSVFTRYTQSYYKNQ